MEMHLLEGIMVNILPSYYKSSMIASHMWNVCVCTVLYISTSKRTIAEGAWLESELCTEVILFEIYGNKKCDGLPFQQ